MAIPRLPLRCVIQAMAAALLFCLIPAAAQAATTVTVCGRDDSAGGTNLRDALAAGGQILIRCGSGPQTITITQTRMVNVPTSIDGEGRITLEGNGAGAMFEAAAPLDLSGLTVRNPSPSGNPAAIVHGIQTDLTLEHVRTIETIGAYSVRNFRAKDSLFEKNGNPKGQSYGVIIDAETIVVQGSTFTGNYDHPVGGGLSAASRAALSRNVTIEQSSFTQNRFPLLLLDAKLIVRASKFVGNGSPAANAAWGCCAGAILLVRSTADISDCDFTGNTTSGVGGAIAAFGSQLSIARSLFASNIARAGGAIAAWGWPIKSDIWSSASATLDPWLRLERVRLRGNSAEQMGGAILWAGRFSGDSVLFTANKARRGGGAAHWTASQGLASDLNAIFAGLQAQTQPLSEGLSLSKGAFLDNVAEQGGGLDAGSSKAELGNTLVARNRANSGAAALEGAQLFLTNSTIANNQAMGVRVAGAGSMLRAANSIIANNDGAACAGPSGAIQTDAATFQYPGQSCGSVARSQEPSLSGDFSPSLLSPVRTSGDVSTCIGHPLVGGADLYGKTRGAKGRCSSGAIEAGVQQDLFAGTPLDPARGGHPGRWAFWIVLIFIIIGIFIGWCLMRRRRRKRCEKLDEDSTAQATSVN